MVLKIYKPSKTAMQSGRSKTKKWIAEYISEKINPKDSLMGWNTWSEHIPKRELERVKAEIKKKKAEERKRKKAKK